MRGLRAFGTLKGRLIDADTERPIAGAVVRFASGCGSSPPAICRSRAVEPGRPGAVERVEAGAAVRAPVTACDATAHSLYLALADGELVRLDLRPESIAPMRYGWRAVVGARIRLPGAATIRAPAVGTVGEPRGLAAPQPTVVYAVAGTDVVYRFTADLEPDERVAVGAP